MLKTLIISSIPLFGETSKDVATLQTRLTELGFALGTIDGIFLYKTKAAVSEFQKSKGLPGTGVIGPKTVAYLGLQVVAQSPVDGQPTITQDIKGRIDRNLHPSLRILMEQKIFPGRVVPQAFKDGDVPKMVNLICIGLDALQITEVGGNNRGQKVSYIQAIIGPYNPKGTGDAWCLSLGQVVVAFIEDYLQKESPVPATEHCMTWVNAAKKIPGLFTEACEVGTIFLMQLGTSSSGHAGLVTQVLGSNRMRTFEGNTGSDGSRDGDGAYYKNRHQRKNGDLTTKGFGRIYPKKASAKNQLCFDAGAGSGLPRLN